MATKIRLGWEARLDQLTIAVDLTVVGVGLVVWGAYLGSALMITPGALLTLLALVRLHGWRSLLWPRTLTIDPDGVTDDTRKATAFHVRWPDVHSVGVITSPDVLTLVFTSVPPTGQPTPRAAPAAAVDQAIGQAAPQVTGPPTSQVTPHAVGQATPPTAPDATGQGAAPSAGQPTVLAGPPVPGQPTELVGPQVTRRTALDPSQLVTRSYRIPRRDAVLPALRAVAPCPVMELSPGEGVVVDVGRAVGRQGVVGGLVAGFFGVVGLVGAFSAGATWARVVAGLIGGSLTLVALGTVLSLPVLLRKRQVVVDAVGFSWVDPGGQSFTIPWVELAGVSVESTVVRNYRTGNRYAVRVILTPIGGHPELATFAAGEAYEIRLGSVPRQGAMIGDAIARLAPGVWRGIAEKPGRIGLT